MKYSVISVVTGLVFASLGCDVDDELARERGELAAVEQDELALDVEDEDEASPDEPADEADERPEWTEVEFDVVAAPDGTEYPCYSGCYSVQGPNCSNSKYCWYFYEICDCKIVSAVCSCG